MKRRNTKKQFLLIQIFVHPLLFSDLVQPFRQTKSLDEFHDSLHLTGSSHNCIANGSTRNEKTSGNNDSVPVEKKSCRKTQKGRFSFERLRRQIHENVNNKYLNKVAAKKDGSLINSNLSSLPNDTIGSDVVEPPKTPKVNDSTKNQLTERVLNWLDLAGKNTLIRPETAMPSIQTEKCVETADNFLQLPKRRILTAETTLKRTSTMRRSESVHHLSLTLNETDLELCNNRRFFEASSRCASALKFGEFFPTTYRCSRKFLASLASVRSGNSSNISRLGLSFPSVNNNFPGYLNLQTQMEQTSKSMPSGGVGGGGSGHHRKHGKKSIDPVELKNMEKEYKNMIHRQILENSCNRQLAKQQLHIFMPNMPNKKSNLPDDTSGLSTIMSSDHVSNKV